jgi:hypothetical protein
VPGILHLPQGKSTSCFRGIKVSAVEEFLLATICDKFWKREREEIAKVILPSPRNYNY